MTTYAPCNTKPCTLQYQALHPSIPSLACCNSKPCITQYQFLHPSIPILAPCNRKPGILQYQAFHLAITTLATFKSCTKPCHAPCNTNACYPTHTYLATTCLNLRPFMILDPIVNAYLQQEALMIIHPDYK